MVVHPILKSLVEEVAQTFRAFAAERSWDECRVFYDINLDWNVIRIYLIVDDYRGMTRDEVIWQARRRLDTIRKKELYRGFAIRLTVDTWDGLKRVGGGSLPENVVEQEDLLAAPVSAN